MRISECHPDRRHRAHGLCYICYGRAHWQSFYKKNREVYLVKRAKNKKERSELQKQDYKINGRARLLAKQTGRPFEEIRNEILALIEKSGYCCEICGTIAAINLDHNHKTGAIRGFLCGSHNRMLGLAREDETILRNTIRYLMQKEQDALRG